LVKAIFIPAWAAEEIRRESAAAYPQECCGILFGRDEADRRVVVGLEPVRNAFDESERHHRFSIDPKTLMQADRTAAEKGMAVVGFYHSHPDHPARPSEYDREHAWPFYSYVIVSLAGGDPIDMTCWVLDESTNTFGRQDIYESEE
jgi:proteasome lid subunit RPN8/RPN11